MLSYLESSVKSNCLGCGACKQICSPGAIELVFDDEGFRYPSINKELCVQCNLCTSVCPINNKTPRYKEEKKVFGGYHLDAKIRDRSTSGGAFTAIVDVFCDENYVIFGAESNGLFVFHSSITDKAEIDKFRKSKYSQSDMGSVYIECKEYLKDGKKVLFSGTPCQISALKNFLGRDYDNLLTVEVVCEGVPSPLYIKKYEEFLEEKFGSRMVSLDYRFKDSNSKTKPTKAKWDFEVMKITLENGKVLKYDRWFNPFWSIWLGHLMTRPSCYICPFTTQERCADITLGDLWGVHLYCPDLYGKNLGCSLIVCNSAKGKNIINKLNTVFYGRELDFNEALKYQSPLRKNIDCNPLREECIRDLKSKDISFSEINKRWSKKPTLKLLYQKYVWGNRQKIAYWNLFHK